MVWWVCMSLPACTFSSSALIQLPTTACTQAQLCTLGRESCRLWDQVDNPSQIDKHVQSPSRLLCSVSTRT